DAVRLGHHYKLSSAFKEGLRALKFYAPRIPRTDPRIVELLQALQDDESAVEQVQQLLSTSVNPLSSPHSVRPTSPRVYSFNPQLVRFVLLNLILFRKFLS